MRLLGLGLLGVAAAVVVLVVACGKDEVQHSVQCSDGAPYTLAMYPEPKAASTTLTGVPECVPRCGQEQKYSGFRGAPYFLEYALEALPTGSCEFDKDHCQMTAGVLQTCGADRGTCDQSGFECFCEGDTWKCYATNQGAGLCLPCGTDGGVADGG